jgi:hypothetical protein
MPEPVLPPREDGLYPRCVRCQGELYMPSVILYSQGKVPCTAVNGCGQFIPSRYLKQK